MSQAPPRQKTTAPASSQSSGNMTARRKQGSNLQFEAMKSTAIPSLFDICAKLLQTHVDSLPILDNVEDAIIQRILSACDATKLDEIESKNEQAGIELNTDDLWRILTIRDFGGACADKDPVISRRAASNTIRNSSGSRSRSSSSSSSRSRNTSNTATTAPKKSKLWTKSLGETSTSRKTKESTTTSAPQKFSNQESLLQL
ncbi:hypothetical protein FDP41_013325 [Naegleria fowleri]|uniref:Uncharacterized protein n=1 Tax=Naegleria fowleri TaxID=5763 RepID=A0A6A5C251_NAEFO|nr:uncharacterized protein FDP41_013325 [Naegleria fowleri]KAF0980842.1 hypothetical protein FDP41_013325 [Naegleria fowleri]